MSLALAWKPPGIGSQDFLGALKKKLGLPGPARQGIGHSGTLDPFAEGLLCIGTQEGTKLLAPLIGLPKVYKVGMLLGLQSESFDPTSAISETVALEVLREKLQNFDFKAFLASKLGPFAQSPPPQSAVHIDGKRAYEWAREGKAKVLAAREVELFSAEHFGLDERELANGQRALLWTFQVGVSSGTYIRSFARDWGFEITGHAAMLETLVRSEIGPLSLDAGEIYRELQVADLQKLFSTLCLSASESEALKKYGRWNPQRLAEAESLRPWLLLSEQKLPIAWAEAKSGRLGRVFLNNPLN